MDKDLSKLMDKDLSKLNVKELKNLLKQNNLSTTGRKDELIKRIQDNGLYLPPEITNDIDKLRYRITKITKVREHTKGLFLEMINNRLNVLQIHYYLNSIECQLLIEIIRFNTSLLIFDLEYAYQEDHYINMLLDSLSQHPRIFEINLSNNAMKDIHLKSFKISPSLEILNLSGNQFGNEGLKFLSSNDFLNLNTLILSGNYISDIGIISLSKVLLTNTSITKLDLSRNYILDSGLTILGELLEVNNTIRELHLNNLTSNIANNWYPLFKSLEINQGLSYLNISNNYVSSQDLAILSDSLTINYTLNELFIKIIFDTTNFLKKLKYNPKYINDQYLGLRRLDLGDIILPNRSYDIIAEELKDNYVIEEIFKLPKSASNLRKILKRNKNNRLRKTEMLFTKLYDILKYDL